MPDGVDHAPAAVDEAALAQLTGMGFEQDIATRALQCAGGDVEVAAEHLLAGDVPTAEQMAEMDLSDDADGDEAAAGMFDSLGAEISEALAAGNGAVQPVMDALRASPAFTIIRLMIQQQPHLLGPLTQQIVSSSPELAALIQANQEAFAGLIAEPLPQEAMSGLSELMQQAPGAAMQADVQPDDEQGDPAQVGDALPEITPEEREAVERLMALTTLAYPLCLQAFLACDRNENLAANFLFEN